MTVVVPDASPVTASLLARSRVPRWDELQTVPWLGGLPAARTTGG